MTPYIIKNTVIEKQADTGKIDKTESYFKCFIRRHIYGAKIYTTDRGKAKVFSSRALAFIYLKRNFTNTETNFSQLEKL